MKKTICNNEKGFALVMAIIGCLILLAVGLLVINMSTGDLIGSSMTVGNKKALVAMESGVHRLLQDFSTDATTWTSLHNYSPMYDNNLHLCGADNYAAANYIFVQIPGGTDSTSQFAICAPLERSDVAPMAVSGYGMGFVDGMFYHRYDTTVVGRNTSYDSKYQVNVGIGFGPVPNN
jgi:hypothetical protein